MIERTLSKEPKVTVERLVVNLSLWREYRTLGNALQTELASMLGQVWKVARKKRDGDQGKRTNKDSRPRRSQTPVGEQLELRGKECGLTAKKS